MSAHEDRTIEMHNKSIEIENLDINKTIEGKGSRITLSEIVTFSYLIKGETVEQQLRRLWPRLTIGTTTASDLIYTSTSKDVGYRDRLRRAATTSCKDYTGGTTFFS